MRRLIVNADDFGLTEGINSGILDAHTNGIVTSASLMVRHPAARDAASRSRRFPNLGVGLHLDLGEWKLTDHRWMPIYTVVPLDDVDRVAQEVTFQIDHFRSLMGCLPTHVDSHQHVHQREPVRSVVLAAAKSLHVPVRAETAGISYVGKFYGQGADGEPLCDLISPQSLARLIRSLGPGVSELSCHPGYWHSEQLPFTTMYTLERDLEIKALCDPQVHDSLRDGHVEQCTFRGVWKVLNESADQGS